MVIFLSLLIPHCILLLTHFHDHFRLCIAFVTHINMILLNTKQIKLGRGYKNQSPAVILRSFEKKTRKISLLL